MAKAMCGRNCCRIEAPEGIRQPVASQRRRHGATLCQQLHYGVSGGEHGTPVQVAAEARFRRHQALTHPVSQLAGSHPGEGDDQDVRKRDAVGYQAGHQRCDGEGFAGTRAGLEDGYPRPR